MESPAQKCVRLVTVLEDLVAQEAICLQTRNFAGAIAIQDRAAPLVEHLSTHGAAVADEALKHRITLLMERRRETGAWLTRELEHAREQLHGLQASQRRVAKVAPVYGRSGPTRAQFSARG